MELKRVVVTGLGGVTPLGNTITETWKNICAGVSGAANITRFDTTKFKTKFACEVKNFDPTVAIDKKEVRRLDIVTQYALVAAQEAVKDARLDTDNSIDKNDIGVIWSSGIGGLETLQNEIMDYAKGDGTPRFSPFLVPKMILDITSGHISIRYGFRGPNYAPVAACASSTNAMIDAFTFIRLNKAKVIVAGGTEASILITSVGGFSSMKALSERNDSPQTASRPFDLDRDGFVLGEGAVGLIFEEYEHAKARGAKIYAEVVGGGMSADAYHITAPHPEGLGATLVMQRALEDAGLKSSDIDYVNVHGTSTLLGDISEIKAIQAVFGEHAFKMNISSTKSMTGHLLGAAGAIEGAIAVLSVVEDIVPPTINHFTDDPAFDSRLNLTFNKMQKRTVKAALSNTFGFGGHNASIIFKKI